MAESALDGIPAGVAVGHFGFVSLVDAARQAIEFECLILELSEVQTAIIGTPGCALVTDSGEWVGASRATIAELSEEELSLQLTVETWDMPVVLKVTLDCRSKMIKDTVTLKWTHHEPTHTTKISRTPPCFLMTSISETRHNPSYVFIHSLAN